MKVPFILNYLKESKLKFSKGDTYATESVEETDKNDSDIIL